MAEVRFAAGTIEGAVILRVWSGAVESLAKLSPQQARDLAQVLLATADEAAGDDARF